MKSKKIVWASIGILAIGGVAWVVYSNMHAQKSPGKEGIVCSSTIPARCYKYRCTTGYFNPLLIPPGGGQTDGTGLCDDGSNAQNLGEVTP